jgi:hypothetical protein
MGMEVCPYDPNGLSFQLVYIEEYSKEPFPIPEKAQCCNAIMFSYETV